MKRSVVPLLLSLSLAPLACTREQPPAKPAAAAVKPPREKQTMSFEQENAAWRTRRRERLTSDDGWLTLVGLPWLESGSNTLGSDPESDLRLPSKLPAHCGTVTLEGDKVTLDPDPAAGFTLAGKPLKTATVLTSDADPNVPPSTVRAGTVSFFVVKRSDANSTRYGLRVKDTEAETRTKFKGLDYFPANPKYRVEARFQPYNPPKKLPITNVLGMTSDETVPGVLIFTLDGKEQRVEPILEAGETNLFLIFKDATSGKETYGAARYLYAAPAGPDGKTIVDFNQAYNPPCAFTHFATCPLPPPQNRLAIRIEAGEKLYQH